MKKGSAKAKKSICNPLTWVAIVMIQAYRYSLGPIKHALFGSWAACRFQPTCSEYGLESFRKHGFIKGFCLTTHRILRCNPWCKGGYDPVPEDS